MNRSKVVTIRKTKIALKLVEIKQKYEMKLVQHYQFSSLWGKVFIDEISISVLR